MQQHICMPNVMCALRTPIKDQHCRSIEYTAAAIRSRRLSVCVYVLCRPLQAAASLAVPGPSTPADLIFWNSSQVHVALWCFEDPVRWNDPPLSRLADPAYTAHTLCYGSTSPLIDYRDHQRNFKRPEGLSLALHHKGKAAHTTLTMHCGAVWQPGAARAPQETAAPPLSPAQTVC